MTAGSDSGNELSDLPYGTRNFLAFAQTPARALQLLRKGTIEGTALVVSSDDIKSMFGITEYPVVAAVQESFGRAAFHRKGQCGVETKAGTTYDAVQSMSEQEFQAALAKAKAATQVRPRP